MVPPGQTANSVVKALVNNWFYIYDIPGRIHSNKGKCFDKNIVVELCKMYGIDKFTTIPYYILGNSLCKKFNRLIKNLA